MPDKLRAPGLPHGPKQIAKSGGFKPSISELELRRRIFDSVWAPVIQSSGDWLVRAGLLFSTLIAGGGATQAVREILTHISLALALTKEYIMTTYLQRRREMRGVMKRALARGI